MFRINSIEKKRKKEHHPRPPPLSPPPHQLFEQRGQDVVQRLVADGGVQLLEGLGRRLADLLQGVAQSLPHRGHQGLGEDQHLEGTWLTTSSQSATASENMMARRRLMQLFVNGMKEIQLN